MLFTYPVFSEEDANEIQNEPELTKHISAQQSAHSVNSHEPLLQGRMQKDYVQLQRVKKSKSIEGESWYCWCIKKQPCHHKERCRFETEYELVTWRKHRYWHERKSCAAVLEEREDKRLEARRHLPNNALKDRSTFFKLKQSSHALM